MKSFLLSIAFVLTATLGFSTTNYIYNLGNSFAPDTITITVGDSVFFDLSSSHNAIEVSQTTWNSNGNSTLSGGFQTSYGGGLVLPSHLALGTHYYVCAPHASMGMKGVIIVQSCIPAKPGTISGNAIICLSSSNSYRIAAVNGATSYTWTLPSGWSGSSTTDSINTIAGSSSGNVSVTADNACGSSAAKTLLVRVNSIPSTPGNIIGNSTVCSGSTNNYSITPVNGATFYTWTLPSGWSGTSTSNSISTTAGSSGGNITVKANNACGSTTDKTLAITVNSVPSTPIKINGDTNICEGSSNTFSIAAVNGATSYTWSLPSGWSGSSSKDSITVIAGKTAGNITVTANNSCGKSAAQSLLINVSSIPSIPAFISGDTIVCISSSRTYSIVSVNTATSYTWKLPSGWLGTSSTNSINSTVGSASGNISVTANNICGSSQAKSLFVTVNASTPVILGAIIGDTVVCDSSLNNYSILAVDGATDYTWILPNDWTGNSKTNSISTVVIKTTGNISIIANNSCGSSAAQNLHVTISGGSALPQPQFIFGDTTICEGTSNKYSITAIGGASSYNWTLPDGWSGISNSNSITAIANTKSGIITVSAQNHCGLSAPKTIAVTVISAPILTDSIIGNSSICAGGINIYSVGAVEGATSYSWILPSGWTGNSTSNTINTMANTLSGIITVTANNKCGSSTSQKLDVTTNNVNRSVSQSGKTLKSDDSGASYQWINCADKTPIKDETSRIFNASVNGSYAVIVTKNNCSDTSSCYEINSTGISPKLQQSGISVYPNPSNGKFYISIKDNRLSENFNLGIYNLQGKQIYQSSNFSISEIELANQPKGIYFLKVYNGQSVYNEKIFIQ